MRRRWALMGTYVGGVALLAAWVVTRGPAPNTIAYHYETEASVTVEVLDGTVEVQAALLDAADFEQEGPIDVEAGMTLVALRVVEPSNDDGLTEIVYPLDRPVSATLPVLAGGDQIAVLSVELTPVPVTGDDLDIPGAVDIPAQRLPRPAVGQAIPSALGPERRPVWIVGLDQEVVVVDARSPHDASGLVGWCGSMPGFIDSIGGDRFTATGEYAFGPAPHGLTSYEVVQAADHVTVTRRLAPPARAFTNSSGLPLPLIQGSPVPQGPFCDIDTAVAQQANEDGYYLEDFRGDPTWVQHDLSAWPDLARADGDGWWRTDEVDVERVPVLTGDLLVRTRRGRIVDAAAAPGIARYPYQQNTAPSTRVMQLLEVDRENRTVELGDVVWVTPGGVYLSGEDPPEPSRRGSDHHPRRARGHSPPSSSCRPPSGWVSSTSTGVLGLPWQF